MTDSPLNILVATSYYHPEMSGTAPYITGVAEYLSERGHHVVVATSFPHYPTWSSGARGRLLQAETRRGVRIRRRWAYVPSRQSTSSRGLYEATLYALGLSALPLRRRPDLVLGTCPSLAAGALTATAAGLYRVPYGLVFQDLMGLAAAQSGVPGGSAVASRIRTMELALARRATRVAVVADGFRPYLVKGGASPENVFRIRNWTRWVEPTETPHETRVRLGWSPDEVVCLHAGNMGHKQGLDNLIDAARLLRKEKVRIVLAGDGNDRRRLEMHVSDLELRNVDFVDPQEPGKWEALLCAADLLVVNQRQSVADMSLPSKLTSYFAAGRPVIAAASADSETAREMMAASAGVVVPPNDPNALRNAIVSVVKDANTARTFGRSAKLYAAQHLSPAPILAQYERMVREIAESPRRRLADACGNTA